MKTAGDRPRTGKGEQAAADGDPTTALHSPTRPVTRYFDRLRPRPLTRGDRAHQPIRRGGHRGGARPGRGLAAARQAVQQRLDGAPRPGDTRRRRSAPCSGRVGRTVRSPRGSPTPRPQCRRSPEAPRTWRSAAAQRWWKPGSLRRRPGDVHGDLTLTAPQGITVTAPADISAPRGTTAAARSRSRSRPGPRPASTGAASVRLGGDDTDGTGLCRARRARPGAGAGYRATSSGDETADFPAAAAIDSDPEPAGPPPPRTALGAAGAGPPGPDRPVVAALAGRLPVPLPRPGLSRRPAPGAPRPPSATPEAAARRSGWTRATPAFCASRATQRATRFGCSLWSVQAYAIKE